MIRKLLTFHLQRTRYGIGDDLEIINSSKIDSLANLPSNNIPGPKAHLSSRTRGFSLLVIGRERSSCNVEVSFLFRLGLSVPGARTPSEVQSILGDE